MKKILALALVLALVLSTFAACRGNEDDDTTTSTSNDGGVTVGAFESTSEESTTGEDSTEQSDVDGTNASGSSVSTNKTPVVTVKPITRPGSSTVGNQGVDKEDVDPSEVYEKVYTVTYKEVDGKNYVTVDGKEYNLNNSADLKEINDRIKNEPGLGPQIIATNPAKLAVLLGAGSMADGSVLSYSYDPAGEFFYVDDINSWQQHFGFNKLYDFAAGFTVMYYDTVRLKFNYKNVGYMLQLWKGQYGLMFIGSEIGIYKKDDNTPVVQGDKLDHFDCGTDDLLMMEMACYRVLDNGTYQHLFTNPYGLHWWSTGFVPGALNNFSDRSNLVVEARLTMHDEEMADIVGATFKVNGFREIERSAHSIYNPDTYYVNGKDVVFVWRYIKHSKDVTILAPTTTTTAVATDTTTS